MENLVVWKKIFKTKEETKQQSSVSTFSEREKEDGPQSSSSKGPRNIIRLKTRTLK